MSHMSNIVYVKIATVTQVPGLLTPPPPLHVAPSGAAAAGTRSGHQVAPPSLAAPATFRAPTVGGAEAARCVSGSAGRVQTPGWRGRGHSCESPESSRSVVEDSPTRACTHGLRTAFSGTP